MNMNRILSNGEMKVFKKIKNKGMIENKKLSERENYIAKQLLQKGIIDYKIVGDKVFYRNYESEDYHFYEW